MEKAYAKDEDKRVAEYRAIEARLRAAVEAGEISQQDADRRLQAACSYIFEDKRSNPAIRRLLAYLFEQVDLDKSESLSLSEINTAIASGNERIARLLTGLQESFERVDRNRDGELSKRECHAYLKAIE